MRTALAALQPVNMHATELQVDLIPAQRHQLADAQSVTIGEQDHRRVAMAVATPSASRHHQLVDLVGCQIGARRRRRWKIANCPDFSGLFSLRNWLGCGGNTHDRPPYWEESGLKRDSLQAGRCCRIAQAGSTGSTARSVSKVWVDPSVNKAW